MSDDDRYSGVLSALRDLHADWQTFKAESLALIVEHRKTVNSAISALAQEALESQTDTKQRLEADAAQRDKRQKRADRKDIALFSSVGCLIALNMLALITLAIVLIVLQWR